MLIIIDQLQLPQLSPRYLSRSCCLDSPGTCGLQTVNLVSSKLTGQKWPFLLSNKRWIFTVIRTHLSTCAFLMQKKAFGRVNHGTLAKKLLDRNVPLHIVKLFIFWYREQEFVVRLGNSLSVTSDVQMGSGKGDSCRLCCIIINIINK